MIWCRDSQIKIKYGPPGFKSPEIAHCTFDLLRASRLKVPARLSKEVIQCLTHGGVSSASLLSLFENQLKAELEEVIDLAEPHSLVKLYDFVSRAESVPNARLRREALGLSRALGYGEELDQSDYDVDADDGLGEQSMAWAPDLVSGLPSSIAETVMAFLAAGFHPWQNRLLFDKVAALLKMTMENVIVRYKVSVPLSAEGFAIPGE